MPVEIKVALIALAGVIFTAVASIVTQVILTKKGQKEMLESMMASIKHQSELDDQKLNARLETFQAVTETKIEELTRKVEKHNNLIERTYMLEGAMTEAQHDIRDLKAAQH
jgi:hypothetical protein